MPACISDDILKSLKLPSTCHQPLSFSGQKMESQPPGRPLLSHEQAFLRTEFLFKLSFKVRNNTY